MAFHALADYQNHVIGWLQWEQSSLGDGAVVRFPRIWMSSGECRLNPEFLRAIAQQLNLPQERKHGLPRGLTPEDVLHYAYAVFHSPSYRSRYGEFLKIDFLRLPLTGNEVLFRALAGLGSELTALHLLESPKLAKPITEFIGPPQSRG